MLLHTEQTGPQPPSAKQFRYHFLLLTGSPYLRLVDVLFLMYKAHVFLFFAFLFLTPAGCTFCNQDHAGQFIGFLPTFWKKWREKKKTQCLSVWLCNNCRPSYFLLTASNHFSPPLTQFHVICYISPRPLPSSVLLAMSTWHKITSFTYQVSGNLGFAVGPFLATVQQVIYIYIYCSLACAVIFAVEARKNKKRRK